MRLLIAGIFIITSGTIAIADNGKVMQVASGLGSVLASEQLCNLTYDQGAIEKYITENVPADNMNFSGMLNMMVQGTKIEFDQMSPSQKRATCTQNSRVAKSYGFIK